MQKPLRIWRIAFATTLLLSATLSLLWPREPSFGGKRLSVWLKSLSSGTEAEQQEARSALLAIGTNALPRLARDMSARETPAIEKSFEFWRKHFQRKFPFARAADRRWQAMNGFKVLAPVNSAAATRLTALLRDDASVFPALQTIDEIALTNASHAVSKLLVHTNWMVRANAAASLGNLRPWDSSSVVGLVGCLRDGHWNVRGNAAASLSNVERLDSSASSALITCLADTNESVRLNSISALAKCGAEARSAVPILTELSRSDTSLDVRKNAARVLREIQEPGARNN